MPKHCAELAELVCRWHITLHTVGQLKPQTALDLLKKTDAFRRPERFLQALNVCLADQQGRLGMHGQPYPQRGHWQALLSAAQSVDSAAIAQTYREQAQHIPQAIEEARLKAIRPLQEGYRKAAADSGR